MLEWENFAFAIRHQAIKIALSLTSLPLLKRARFNSCRTEPHTTESSPIRLLACSINYKSFPPLQAHFFSALNNQPTTTVSIVKRWAHHGEPHRATFCPPLLTPCRLNTCP